MVSIYKIDNVNEKKEGKYISCELRGLSTDTKPTAIGINNIANGSTFVEIDTGNIYFYDEENQEWNEA